MTTPLLLGLDAGTSGVKACLFTMGGEPVRQVTVPVFLQSPGPGYAELDLEEYWRAVARALQEIAPGIEGIAGLGLSVTSPTTVFFGNNQEVLRPGIPYLDNRGTEEVDKLAAALGGKEAFRAQVGNLPIPSTCAAGTVRWVMKHEPETWERTAKIGFLNTFLAARLTGKLAVDPTTASYSGLVRIADPYHWNEDLGARAEIPPAKLPPILPPFHRIGQVTKAAARATGLPPGLPVALGCADTAAAAFALGLSKQGDAFESAGTSDVLTFCLEEPDFDAAFLNRAHVLPGRWLAHGAMSTTGGAVEWLRSKAFPELASAAEVEAEAARSVPGAHGVVFLPYLAGERSPIFDPAARGLWLGLRRDTTRADLVRAVYEGIAFGLRQILNQAERHWSFGIKSVVCVGGGAMSSLGLKVRADVLGLTCRSVAFPHGAALGAALLGGIAAGVFAGPEDPALPFLRTSTAAVHPDPQNKTIYDQLFQVYDHLYSALVEAMHALP